MKAHDSNPTESGQGGTAEQISMQLSEDVRMLANLLDLVRHAHHLPKSRIVRILLEALLDDLESDTRFSTHSDTTLAREEHGHSQHNSPLTSRQLEIIALRARGLRAKDIAQILSLSEATIHTHVRNACTRLGVSGGWVIAMHKARELDLLDGLLIEYPEKIPKFTK